MRDEIAVRVRELRSKARPALSNGSVVLVLLLLAVSGVAVAQDTTVQTWADDFEDGNTEGWQAPTDDVNPQISTDSFNGSYSLLAVSAQDDDRPVQWTGGPVLDLDDDFTIQGTIRPVFVDSPTPQIRFGVSSGNVSAEGENAFILFDQTNNTTYLSTEAQPDTLPSDTISGDFDGQWVRFEISSDAGDSTVEAKVWDAETTEPSSPQLTRQFDPVSGTFSIEPGTDAGGSQDREVYLDWVSITGTEQPSENLTLQHNNWMEYGETQPYTVTYDADPNTTGTIDVTENATVTSLNTSVVEFNDGTMTATTDESVNARVQTRAEYDGQVDYNYVVVASQTVENLDILPPIYRFSAVLGDDTIFFLLLATLTSIVATRFTTAFGGISGYWIVVMMGWISGWLSLGILLVTTCMAIFIGLNLALTIDYGAAGRIRR